jgi:hypothetical protein
VTNVMHIFVNNLMTGNKNFNRPLLYVWQPASICDKASNSQLEQIDHNIYVRSSNSINTPLILWSPAKNNKCMVTFDSPEELHKLHPEFSAHSKYVKVITVLCLRVTSWELSITNFFPASECRH